jgi:hypothetical protein
MKSVYALLLLALVAAAGPARADDLDDLLASEPAAADATGNESPAAAMSSSNGFDFELGQPRETELIDPAEVGYENTAAWSAAVVSPMESTSAKRIVKPAGKASSGAAEEERIRIIRDLVFNQYRDVCMHFTLDKAVHLQVFELRRQYPR